jgi:hypothetical protein
MLRKLRRAIVSFFLVTTCGCYSVMQVSSSKGKLNGVPFYVKVSGCKHERVWIEPVLQVSLLSPNGAVLGSKSVPLSRSLEVLKLQNSDHPQEDFDKLSAADPLLVKATEVRITQDSGDFILMSDALTPSPIVDYSNTYYLNAAHPWIGSASANAELGADGTLSKASGQVETKTLQSFLDLIPASKLISAAAGVAAEAVGKIRIQVTPKYYKISRSKLFVGPCQDNLRTVDETYDYTREEVKSAASEKGDKKNTISVSGEVQLPEPKK